MFENRRFLPASYFLIHLVGDMSGTVIIFVYAVNLFGKWLAAWALSANQFFHPNLACKPITSKS